jgi:hypothetical protein
VLGGGGFTGVAFEIWLQHLLAELDVDLATAGPFVGTSAGSVVAAQLTGGAAVAELRIQDTPTRTAHRSRSTASETSPRSSGRVRAGQPLKEVLTHGSGSQADPIATL